MQDNAMSKWLSPLMAFCLSFLIIATLAPITGIQIDRQLDFWLLWLATMLILALPVCYLEIALAKRSKTTALQALSSLTREADSSQRWRLVGWLAVVFIPFLSGAMLNHASNVISVANLNIQQPIIFAVLAIAAFVLSLVPRLILVGITTVGVLASLVLANVMGTQLPAWQVTPVQFSEWGNVTVLALVASGLGMGLYWQSSLAAVKQQDVATKTALPIWIAQLLAVIAFGFFAVKAQVPAFALMAAIVAAAALMLQMAREQLQQRQMNVIIQWVVVVVAALIWLIPNIAPIFNNLLILWGLVISLIYALFAGWIMKISHLRKSMNFSSEAFYNIWRIAVRIVLPVAIITAIIAVLGQWF
ncbi:membrane protein [Acinetobacter sp. HR7]|uniref:membrane protein n=1 Tax=Acinetobacter sp. HR7 TaxID=1509403 RepID=UPI00053842D2|nr:membrane protein [Acinetobacter sp. HR7]KGT47427.1 membrane protein [Acinetobacter sp. HR7]